MKGRLLVETLPALLLAEAVPKMDAHYASIVLAVGVVSSPREPSQLRVQLARQF